MSTAYLCLKKYKENEFCFPKTVRFKCFTNQLLQIEGKNA